MEDEAGKPEFDKRPVWLLRYTGVCVPIYGPHVRGAKARECAGTELNVVVDAETGEVLDAFSYR
jgi:hypothetical protein